MIAYKGFYKNMKCRDFQYKEGKTYKTDRAKVCDCGFHACENPLECLNYYALNDSVYHEVEVGGAIEKSGDDSKIAATKITIGAELTIAGLVKGAIDFVFSKVKPTSGDYANAATSGDYANAATSGNCANAEVKGKDSIAVVLGRGCKARGDIGCWIVLTERDEDMHILGVQAVKVDGKRVKPDKWYKLRDGKVVEVKE